MATMHISVAIFVHRYDDATRLAEKMSIIPPSATAAYPSVPELRDLFETTFYKPICDARAQSGVVSRLYLQGTSPALCRDFTSGVVQLATDALSEIPANLSFAGFLPSHIAACVKAVTHVHDTKVNAIMQSAFGWIPAYTYFSTDATLDKK